MVNRNKIPFKNKTDKRGGEIMLNGPLTKKIINIKQKIPAHGNIVQVFSNFIRFFYFLDMV